jgi:hypothetical protein
LRRFLAAIVAAAALGQGRADAQNDWQYPDPYFGILEIEKSHTPAADRRYRAEVSPPAKPRVQPVRPRLFRPRPRTQATAPAR